jgi:probable phosphoglycerate mutase
MRNLYVVTHAESQHHVDKLVGGWYDSELTARGRAQAVQIADRMRHLIPAGEAVDLHSSDLKRAVQTAEPISKVLGTPIRTTSDLRELSYGEADGMPDAWLDEHYVFPPLDDGRMDHLPGFDGAESRRDIATRVYRAMDQILATGSPNYVIVTHSFALSFLVAAWIRVPIEAAAYIHLKPTSGGITHLKEDDAFHNRSILALSDTSHLASDAPPIKPEEREETGA